MRRRRGFSLSEVLIAVVLVALLALGILAVVGGGLHGLFASKGSGVCLQLGQEKMEGLLSLPPTSLSNQPKSGTFNGLFTDYQWKLDTQPVNGILKLTVTVHGLPGVSATLTAYARQTEGQIVFARGDGSTSQLWLCQADGSGLKQLTHDSFVNRTPALSPDGKLVAFVSNRGGDGNTQVYLLTVSTLQVTPVTRQPGGANAPAWAADGRIAYAANDGGYSQIFVTSAGGGNGHNVSQSQSHDSSPAFSANGDWLSWVTDRFGGMDIVVAHSDGSSPTRVTHTPGWNACPSWCPDGSGRIAFLSSQDGHGEICLVNVNADTGEVTALTHGTGDVEGQPSWNPAGTQILFARAPQPQGLSTLYVVNADGTGQRPLWPNVTVATEDPAWVR